MKSNTSTSFQRLLPPLVACGILTFLSTVLRIVLATAFPSPNPVSGFELLHAFGIGLLFDSGTSLVLTTPMAMWATLRNRARPAGASVRRIGAVTTTLAWSAITFLFVAEGFFFEEFQSRYNPVAVDYLIYPHEVFVNVWQSYPLVWVILACIGVGVFAAWLTFRALPAEQAPGRKPVLALAWLAAAVLAAFLLQPSFARFSRDRVVNELAGNTFVSLAQAVFTRNLDYEAYYPTLPAGEAMERARKLVFQPGHRPAGPTNTLFRRVPGDPERPKLNLILLLEESLGSEFWGSLGRPGESLMPRMDALATNEALLFDNLYADGNRTIRGYEGVYCSFPPLPGDSVVARDRTDGFETLAQVLDRDGYETTFIYAGRGVFDGTGNFARKNGWKRFLELKDFKDPAFTTVWGVCSEDLYDRAIVEMREAHRAGRPFFITTMSVSNHKPYTYPAGRIPQDPLEKRRDYVVRYTDHALGSFFEKARKEAFWSNTVFAVVADHGARVYGSQTIPIRSYEIPMVVLGPAVVPRPQRVSKLGSQLDVAPTLLGLLGRPYLSTFFGHDLIHDPESGHRVLLHHNRSVGIYADERLVVFNLNRHIEYFAGNPKSGQMHRVTEADTRMKELETDATALFQVGDLLYMDRRYRDNGADH
jgi:phosphoglycerol transferase MdoB-like AlkP superfamily enzyme